ncbi:cyclase family protein [Methanosarcina sp.]|uniref:cyclase family protein n=1 Tax=Methanosarcina sp. TaxID=2213 RepID=UPI003C780A3D
MEKVPVDVEGLPVSMEETQFGLEKIPAHGKIIDITTPISPFTRIFPGDPVPAIERVCTLEKEGCAVSRVGFGSHTGTHVDAPSHVLENGLTVDKLELKSLMGTALILDFSSLSGELTADILENALKNTAAPGNLPILLLKTDAFSRKQRNAGEISPPGEESGSQSMESGKEEFDSAYLEESGAAWIVEKGFRTIGIDGFSVDNLSSETLPAHHILLSGNVNIVECLELGSVEAGIYFFLCLPLKIERCDGSPARALLISYF